MLVVISGEGSSDLGRCNNQQGSCSGENFDPGPMCIVLDTLIESRMGYSLLCPGLQSYVFLSERHLEECEQRRKENRKSLFLRGKKMEQETGYFHINAYVLAQETLELQAQRNDDAIAVLFRDTDGTRSTISGLWQAKWDSMVSGFARAGLGERGVPMLPKPKSEAWLLCAFEAPTYQECAVLEQISGNDRGAKPAKERLEDALGQAASRDLLVERLTEQPFEHATTAEQMPSFAAFRARLLAALEAIR
ncbi:hypothetical protein NS2R_12105 [Pseudomonas oryzihabitans]|nr:hypothetical protein NS2R_12105 [Pseudomonas psychrotolerans]